MFVNKIGSYHTEDGTNNQDSGFEYRNTNCVVDGCSAGKHSEIGAKLYAKKLLEKLILKDHIFEKYPGLRSATRIADLIETFEDVLRFVTVPCDSYPEFLDDVHNYMLFTILFLEEDEDGWDFYICGDGFVITQDHKDRIKIHDIDHAPAPMYLSYFYVKEESLDLPENEKGIFRRIPFKVFRYSKKRYNAIGIATDGIDYVVGTEHEDEFKRVLLTKKDFMVKRFINKLNYEVRKLGGNGFFKDDITISMRWI